jgi:hypothetical protein
MSIVKSNPQAKIRSNRAASPMAKNSSKHLQQLFSKLPVAQQSQLVDYAEFLASRHQAGVADIAEPVELPRPQQETVISAMKRLRQTYPMLDPENLLNETSALMGEHLLQGKPASEVIDRLEAFFNRHYEALRPSGDATTDKS